jgi:phosphate transport system permease protein
VTARDRWLIGFLRAAAGLAGGLVVLIALFLIGESAPALSQVGHRFVTDDPWHPAAQADQGTFQILPIAAGTVLSAAGALVLAGGLGIFSAVCLHFYAPPRPAQWFRGLIDLMAGVPSVVYGLWGLEVLVPLIARISPPGPSLLAGIIILTMMIVPTVVLLADAALAAVPRESLAAAAALGLSRETTAFRVAVPAARSGLLTALLLGLARALGETMAVVMVCGNVVRLPASVFDPVRTLTATIALEMGYARGDHRSALFVCGLVLLLAVAGIVGLAEVFRRGSRHVPA